MLEVTVFQLTFLSEKPNFKFYTLYKMARKTRREKLTEQTNARLKHIENVLLGSNDQLSDDEFEAYTKEAIKLRNMLKMMKNP